MLSYVILVSFGYNKISIIICPHIKTSNYLDIINIVKRSLCQNIKIQWDGVKKKKKDKNSLKPHDNILGQAINGAWSELKIWHTQWGSGKLKWRREGFNLKYYYPFCKFWSFSFRLLSSHQHFRMLDSLTEKLRNIRDAYIKGTKATFVVVDFGYKNLLNIERPTSETFISDITDLNGAVNWFIICLNHFLNLSYDMWLAAKSIQ